MSRIEVGDYVRHDNRKVEGIVRAIDTGKGGALVGDSSAWWNLHRLERIDPREVTS